MLKAKTNLQRTLEIPLARDHLWHRPAGGARLGPRVPRAASAVAISAPIAEATSFKACGSFKVDGGGKAKCQAKGVSCRAAKKVLRAASMTLCFGNQIPGWKKEWRALASGGKALTLKKGAKVIKTNACSPK